MPPLNQTDKKNATSQRKSNCEGFSARLKIEVNCSNSNNNNNNNNSNNNNKLIIIKILLSSLKFFTKTLHDNYLQHKTICNNNCVKTVKKEAKCSYKNE